MVVSGTSAQPYARNEAHPLGGRGLCDAGHTKGLRPADVVSDGYYQLEAERVADGFTYSDAIPATKCPYPNGSHPAESSNKPVRASYSTRWYVQVVAGRRLTFRPDLQRGLMAAP